MGDISLGQEEPVLPYLGRAFTLPNLLTLVRVFFLPFILLTLLKGDEVLAAVLISAALATDAVDGWLARRLNQISNVGKVLDPVVDKITIGSILVLLTALKGFPPWIAALIILRDVTILGLGGLLIKRRHIILTSNRLGKATGGVFFATIIAYTLSVQPAGQYLAFASVGLTLASSVSYLVRLMRMLSPKASALPLVGASGSRTLPEPGTSIPKGGP